MKHNDIKALVAACVNYWENRKSNYLAGSAGEGSTPPRENNDYADGWGKEQAMNMDLESDQNKILGLLFFWMTFDLLITWSFSHLILLTNEPFFHFYVPVVTQMNMSKI